MSILNTAQRNAIFAAVQAGAVLNKNMALVFTAHNTVTGRRDIMWEASAVVPPREGTSETRSVRSGRGAKRGV